MTQKREELLRMMKDLKIDQANFNSDDVKLFENGGFLVSDSEEEKNLGNSQNREETLSSNENSFSRAAPQNFYRKEKREIEANAYKKQIISENVILQNQVSYLEAELKRSQLASEAEKRRIQAECRAELDRMSQDLQELRSKQNLNESQINLIKDSITQAREILQNRCSETNYLRLRSLPEKDLLPSEFVLVKICDLVLPYKRDTELHKQEIENLRGEVRALNDRITKQLNEIEHNNLLLFEKDEDYKRFQLNYENNRRSMEMELQKAYDELNMNRDKIIRFEDMERELKKVTQEKFLLEEKLGYYDTNNAGKKTKGDIVQEQEDMRRKLDLLNNDKDYLSKENFQLLEKNKRLEEKIEKLEKEINEAKAQAQEYLFQLLNQRNTNVIEYESKINKEIAELKEKHSYELEVSKNNLIDIYEKQLRFLKENKDELEIKLDSLTGQLKEKTRSYESLLLENRNVSRRVEGDLSELRIQLRIKSEELERITHIYEETLTNLKSSKIENEMLREKINVLKSEYYKIEIENKDEFMNMKSQLAVAKEQLANYESIEKEVDDAIMGFGLNKDDNNDNVYLNSIYTAPTSTKRRIHQSLNLAKRLQIKQRESEELKKEFKALQDAFEKANDEAKMLKDLLDKTNQPYSYLINAVEEKEKELVRYKQLLKKNDQDYQYLKQEHNELKAMYEKAEMDINKLLVKRENITNIQTLLLKLSNRDYEGFKENASRVLEEVKDLLNRNVTQTQNFEPSSAWEKTMKKDEIKRVETKSLKPKWAQKLSKK